MADSSQKLYNYFCVLEKKMQFPSSHTAGSTTTNVPADTAQGYAIGMILPEPASTTKAVEVGTLESESYSWQLTTLGYGASDLTYKWRNMCHSMCLRCENEESLQAYRRSVVGYTSDAGTERKLVDAAFVHPPTLTLLHSFVIAVKNNEKFLHPGDGAAQMHYLFPYALGMQGHIHMISNAVQSAITKCRFWPAFEPGLRALLAFLNNRDLRKRFLVTCCPPQFHHMFKSWGKQLLDWRWESIGDVCQVLVPLIPVLASHFDLDKISKGGHVASLGDIENVILKTTSKFLQVPWLECIVELLRVVGSETNLFISWLEGCQCHEDIWTIKAPFAKRMEIFRSRTGLSSCWRKGCRGSEMATGSVLTWCTRVSEACSDHLVKCLLQLPVEHRNPIIAVMANIRESLFEEFAAKLEHWNHLPFLLLGLLADDVEIARRCAKQAREEFNAGTASMQHRVSLRFFGDPLIKQQIDAFIESGELLDYPELFNLVVAYNMVPLVERAIEAEHARIEKAGSFIRFGEYLISVLVCDAGGSNPTNCNWDPSLPSDVLSH